MKLSAQQHKRQGIIYPTASSKWHLSLVSDCIHFRAKYNWVEVIPWKILLMQRLFIFREKSGQFFVIKSSVADLHSKILDAPPFQILSISCSFFKIFGKIVCWRPPPGGWRPHLGEFLDQPLKLVPFSFPKSTLYSKIGVNQGCPQILIERSEIVENYVVNPFGKSFHWLLNMPST